uniref:Putative 5'-hydroxyl-kinase nol9 n=1 Tax=Ixodes ricinus TaxID=34613 RepID=A0A6B0VEE9_IXORI
MRPTSGKRPAKRRHRKSMFVKRLTPKLRRTLRIRPKGTASRKPKVCPRSDPWTVTPAGSFGDSTKTGTARLRRHSGFAATSSWLNERREFERVVDEFEKEESASDVSERDSLFDGALSRRRPSDEPRRRGKGREDARGSGPWGEEGGSVAGSEEEVSESASDDGESGSDEELSEHGSFLVDPTVASGAESCDEETSQASDSAYKVFLLSKCQLLAVLKPPVALCLVGRAHLTVLQGALTVDGHLVTPSRSGLLVEAGFLSAPAHLHPIRPHSDSSSLQLRRALSRLGASEAWGSLRAHLGPGSAVVLLERAGERWPACQLGAQGLLPRLKGPYLGLGFKLRADRHRQPWRLPLTTLARRLSRACASPGGEVPRVVVCGRQNSGKSTVLRTLVNSLLNMCPEVVYLDCDPGQSEFTPAAALSLTRVTEPLLGPPFTHVHTPEKMYFLGHVSPASQPDAYSAAVSKLLEHCRQHFPNTPLVVNTMGWVAGIGLSLLVDVIRRTSPTDLIQLRPGSADAEDLPPLDPHGVERACGWLTARGDGTGPRVFSCHQLPGGTWRARSQAKLKRDAMMLAYLGRNILNNDTVTPFWLWSTVPYRVPWCSLAIHDCDGVVRKQDLLHVVAGSVVALCVVPREALLETNKSDYPKFVEGTGPYECLGYGLVRAVDPAEKVFYIFSPEPRERLSQVNALVTGDIHLPDAVLFSQAQMFRQKMLPYVEKNLVSSGEEQQEDVLKARVGDESDCE